MLKMLISTLVLLAVDGGSDMGSETVVVHERKAVVPVVRVSTPPKYVVENPLPYRVQVEFDCGPDYDPVYFKMPPSSRLTFEITAANGDTPFCLLADWKKL